MIEDWMNEIRKVARRAARDWKGALEEEDIAQEVRMHILERPGTQRDLAEMDRDSRYQTLHKIAQRIASQARVDYEHFSGEFLYSVDEVRGLLDLGALAFLERRLGSSWSTGEHIASGHDHSDPTAEAAIAGIRTQTISTDLMTGLRRINEAYADILNRWFIQVERGFDSTERTRLQRALEDLTTEMNHANKRQYDPVRDRAGNEPYSTLGDGPGTRKVVSNSTARYISKEGWDADYVPAPSHLRDNHIEPEVWAS